MSKLKTLIIILSFLLNIEANAIMRTIGLIPTTFPRDTIEFDTYLEQMAIGHVLEPLVISDQFGNIAPSVSDSWIVSEDGLRLTFHIRDDVAFSNGKKITTKDVEYSLSRQWKNNKSQSYPLLKNIKKIKIISNSELAIELTEPQVAILKILSRDHLGIVPAEWSFDQHSSEPYIGSGAYRLLKREKDWIYIKNSKFRNEKKINNEEWRIVFLPKNLNDLESIDELPNFAPALNQAQIDLLRKNKKFDESKYLIKPRIGFTQTLAWWNPTGPNAGSTPARHFKMSIFRELIQNRRNTLHLQPAYGLIPIGVSGHIINEIVFPKNKSIESKEIVAKHADWSKITIVLPTRLMGEVVDVDLIKSIESIHGIKLKVIEENNIANIDLHDVDIIINRWAGGFNDPEGFLPILNKIVKNSVRSYSNELNTKLVSASKELSWSKRSELFRDFDSTLVKESWLIPAWKTTDFTFTSKPLEEPDSNLRYTPKVTDLLNQ